MPGFRISKRDDRENVRQPDYERLARGMSTAELADEIANERGDEAYRLVLLAEYERRTGPTREEMP